jgi:hypothetical protein
MHDQPIGRQADHGEHQIKAYQVSHDEDAEIAGQRQQPPLGEARGIRIITQIGRGVSARDDPQQRRGPKQYRPGHVESQGHAKRRLGQDQARTRRGQECRD